MRRKPLSRPSSLRVPEGDRSTWLRTNWDALAAQAAAYYEESQVERFLDELAAREGCSFARAVPGYRHFGAPEFALQLSWDHQQVAWYRSRR